MDDRIDEGWVTNEELAAWLKLVERDIPKAGNSKPTALPDLRTRPVPLTSSGPSLPHRRAGLQASATS